MRLEKRILKAGETGGGIPAANPSEIGSARET